MSQNFYTFNSFFATRAAPRAAPRARPPVAPHEATFLYVSAHHCSSCARPRDVLGTRYMATPPLRSKSMALTPRVEQLRSAAPTSYPRFKPQSAFYKPTGNCRERCCIVPFDFQLP